MKTCAVFTIVRDEEFMLPLWLRYYERHFDRSDMYVLDHNTIDGSTDNLPCNVFRVEHDLGFDHNWILRTVRGFTEELLKEYEHVLFCEVDEIIWHPDGLANYVSKPPMGCVRTQGFEIWHDRFTEKPIDLSQPILSQRKFMRPHQAYSKPLLTNQPLDWMFGFHNCFQIVEQDPSLWLIHIHFLDYEVACMRQWARKKWKMADDVSNGLGSYQAYVDKEYTEWYDQNRAWELISEGLKRECVI
jgi:hypothetical protein